MTIKEATDLLRALGPYVPVLLFLAALFPPVWKRVGEKLKQGLGIDELERELKKNTEANAANTTALATQTTEIRKEIKATIKQHERNGRHLPARKRGDV